VSVLCAKRGCGASGRLGQLRLRLEKNDDNRSI
jgi:hypothetical protein